MRALILRHGTVNRRVLLLFSPWALIWIAGGLFNSTSALLGGFMLGLVLSAFVMLTHEAMDPNLERFLLSLPVSRAQLVRESYLSGLLALLVGQSLPLLAIKVAHSLAPSRIPSLDPSAWGIAALGFLALATLVCLMLPFRFALGGPKGLMAFAITLVAGLAGLLAWKGLDGLMDGLLRVSERLLEHPAQGALGALGVLAFGVLSLALSVRFYSRRPF